VCICFNLHTVRIFLRGIAQLDAGDVTIMAPSPVSLCSNTFNVCPNCPSLARPDFLLHHYFDQLAKDDLVMMQSSLLVQFLWTKAKSPPLSSTVKSPFATQHSKESGNSPSQPFPSSAQTIYPKRSKSRKSAKRFPCLLLKIVTSTPILLSPSTNNPFDL
jgi:hypothetical protein